MTTRTLRSAIAALAFTALSCGGGDPPGGGSNGGTTDGGDETGDGATDESCEDVRCDADQMCRMVATGEPRCTSNNPLIDVISGQWEVTFLTVFGEPIETPSFDTWATAFPEDPDCSQSLRERRNIGNLTSVGPPGDACIYWTTVPPDWSILDGMRLRYENPSAQMTGDILDGGQRIELTVTFTNGDPPSTIELVKLE